MNREEIIRRNNVKVSGSGTVPMMFAHGFVGDQVLWRLVTPAFQQNYQVILFDYVGSGYSDSSAYSSEKYSNLEGYAQDVIDICEALDLREVIFVGHSISSMIGLLAHIQRPEYFSKMIFIAPSPCFINHLDYFGGFEKRDLLSMMEQMKDNYKAWARDLVPLITEPGMPLIGDELYDALMTTDQKIARKFAIASFFVDHRAELLKMKIPSLIIQCSDDAVVPLQVGDYLHAHLTNNVLKVIQTKGHFPHLSKPKEVVNLISAYLAGD